MSTILHISDLHLGEPEDWQLLGSDRAGMAGPDIDSQKGVLKETLELVTSGGLIDGIDAVVVSGDLTNRCRPDGFTEFAEVAQPLIDRVGAEKIAVVPGNHDVPWDPGPDDPARYDEFLRVTRGLGMVTPILDGRDTDAASGAEHLILGEDFVIVTVNSSHFCWGKEAADESVVEAVLRSGSDELLEVFENLRRRDVARVSNAQLGALRSLLRERLPTPAAGEADDRIRIAVLHHQLLPVSASEEVKAFEALSNLGKIRGLFVELGIQVVLHGHKHTPSLFWDYVAGQTLNEPPRRMLVSAGPGEFLPGGLVMRLLRISEGPRARDVVIEHLHAPARSGGAITSTRERARLWRSTAVDAIGDMTVLAAPTVAEVYAQLRSVFEDRSPTEPLHDLLCEITSPTDAGEVPLDYPHIEGIGDAQQWMDDLVEWWLLRDPQLLQQVTFNHGERIHRRWGDQIERAVETLRQSRPGSTRAVIMLLDPWNDAKPEGDFPSFVLIQLQVVPRGAESQLDCSGYFRKQEMRYWWPINVAELARVQAAVVEGLSTPDQVVAGGRLRTITAYAASEEKLPAVALAEIDRAIDLHRDHLWTMAYGLVHQDEEQARGEVRQLWERYLRGLDPSDEEPSQELPTSYRGLKEIGAILEWLGHDRDPVAVALQNLVSAYDALQARDGPVPATVATVRQARQLLSRLRTELDSVLVDAGAS
jgi:3',5'-cyclic AMP phosphodiesterase CpdA